MSSENRVIELRPTSDALGLALTRCCRAIKKGVTLAQKSQLENLRSP